MKKQVKLLTLLVLAAPVIQASAVDFTDVSTVITKPLHCVHNLVTKKQKSAMLLAAAVVGGLFVQGMEDREFDKDGSYRTVGTPEVDPMISEIGYCATFGAGAAALSQLKKAEDISVKDGIEKSVVNGAAFFLANRVAETSAYRSVTRNHPLLKGWCNKTITDGGKYLITVAAAKEVINYAKDMLLSKAAGK